MTDWINRVRSKRKADNRRQRHEALIASVTGPTARLQAACGWLVSEARQAGRLEETFDAVIAKVNEIREEEQP